MTFLIAIGAFAAALGPLIIFHELGHYFVARLFNVRVLRFSIGFGRPLFKLILGPDRCEWVVAAIPLGGYVAMLDEREAPAGDFSEEELSRAFNRQTVWARIAIVAAGPLTNFLVAILLYAVVFMHGVAEPRAIFAEPPAESIAAKSGIGSGDEAVAVDGTPVTSLVSLRFRLIGDAVDNRDAQLTLANPDGGRRTVTLDFSKVAPLTSESDLLSDVGLTVLAPPPVIEAVDAHGAAEAAGLAAGDKIVAVDGSPVAGFDQFVNRVKASPGKPLILAVERHNRVTDVQITPQQQADATGKAYGAIGVHLQGPPMSMVRYGPVDSVLHGAVRTWDMTRFSAQMLGKMVRGRLSLKNLNGPVTIADYAGQSARLGLGIFLTFIAFYSISLGLMNLLPIPMLDGGHLLYYLVEIIQGRPPSERFLEMSQRAGMAVLACLMSVALFNDFSRLLS
jgi:regulator of sigma E protease